MVFPSFEFAFFFPVVLALSWALMPHPRAWKPFVLAASYAFYAAASPRYCLLLAGVTLANQLGAVLVHRASDERTRKRIVALTVAVDLAALGLFKYYGFFVDEFGLLLDSIGLGMPLPLLTLALPIGLSFITFQAISYVVDVKRGLLAPASTFDFAIYLSFFPHVVAGPIVRAREFIPQLAKPRDPRNVAVGAAVVLIALGLIKKVAIADYLAREVVDPVFGVPEAYAAPDVALAAYAYAAQIYCDFSGYTDIAIGRASRSGSSERKAAGRCGASHIWSCAHVDDMAAAHVRRWKWANLEGNHAWRRERAADTSLRNSAQVNGQRLPFPNSNRRRDGGRRPGGSLGTADRTSPVRHTGGRAYLSSRLAAGQRGER